MNFIMQLWQKITNPKQTVQDTVEHVIKKPVEKATLRAANLAKTTLKENSKPVVDVLVNQAIDAGKKRLIEEGQGFASQIFSFLKGLISSSTKQADKKSTNTSNKAIKIMQNIVTNIIFNPLQWFISSLIPNITKPIENVTKIAIATANKNLKTIGDNINKFMSVTFSIIADGLVKTIALAIRNIGNQLLKAFGLNNNSSENKDSKVNNKPQQNPCVVLPHKASHYNKKKQSILRKKIAHGKPVPAKLLRFINIGDVPDLDSEGSNMTETIGLKNN